MDEDYERGVDEVDGTLEEIGSPTSLQMSMGPDNVFNSPKIR